MEFGDSFSALEARRRKREQERSALQDRLAQLKAEADEDAIALRVLRQICASQDEGAHSLVRISSADTGTFVLSAGSVISMHQQSAMPVKEMVLAILRDAAPSGLTAKQIKGKAVLKYKAQVNPNTLTVTLVRASKTKDGQPALVRCEGRTWFYLQYREEPDVRASELALSSRTAMGSIK